MVVLKTVAQLAYDFTIKIGQEMRELTFVTIRPRKSLTRQ